MTLALLQGCGKKEKSNSQTAAPEASAAVASNNASADPAAPQSQSEIAGVLAATDAALKAKEYDKAVTSLLSVQPQKGLTEQQLQALRDRHLRLQRSLASAIASGDPKAKAAGEMLRAASTPR